MTHYAFQVNITMREIFPNYSPTTCWRSDCKEKTVFLFNFMDCEFPTCAEHAEEFLRILRETYRIFVLTKVRGAK